MSIRFMLLALFMCGGADVGTAKVDCKKELSKKLSLEQLQDLLPVCRKEKPEIERRIGIEKETQRRNEEAKRQRDQEMEQLKRVTPLLYAVAAGRRQTVLTLIQNGTDPNSRLPEGLVRIPVTDNGLSTKGFDGSMTALMVAANLADHAMVKVLLDRRADVNAKDDQGATALIHAIVAIPVPRQAVSASSREEVARERLADMLRQAGAAINSPKSETVETLIAAGADVTLKTSKGLTALSVAKKAGDTRIIELLRKAGAQE